MRARRFCGLPILVTLLVGCGGGSETGTGGGGGGTTTTTSTTTSTTSTTTSTTTTTTETKLPGCEGGDLFNFGDALAGVLDKPDQEDYYRFEGYKGQVLLVDIDAQSIDDVTFDPDYIDAVVTIVDQDGKRVAENDNPTEFSTADPRLYTILPADGTYCIRVAECWTVKSNPGANCLGSADKAGTYYELFAFELIDDGPGDSNTADPEAGNDPASAIPVDFVPAQTGGYFPGYIWGFYETDTDIDVYSFTLPADVPVDPGARGHGSVRAFPAGTAGSGSTIPTGELWIVDPLVPDTPFARVNPSSSYELNVPLELDKEYWLFVNRPAGTMEGNDFYFLSSYPGWGNPLEIDDVGNSDIATAEQLLFSDADSAFVEGDLLPITDVDYFKIDVPNGMTQVTGVCGARTRGSGLRQMKISLLDEAGMLLDANASDIETASQLAYVQNAPVGGNTFVHLKVEAPLQATDATSAFYQCGVHFSP